MSELKLRPGWLARDVARASERAGTLRSERNSSLQQVTQGQSADRNANQVLNQTLNDQQS
jgi:hypothetical protein